MREIANQHLRRHQEWCVSLARTGRYPVDRLREEQGSAVGAVVRRCRPYAAPGGTVRDRFQRKELISGFDHAEP
jgi:hypothetical protein